MVSDAPPVWEQEINMSSQNEAHGDEDWLDVSPEAIHEAAINIICDPDLLGSQLNDTALALSLSDICSCVDNACQGDPIAIQSLTRSAYQLKLVLLAFVQDRAWEMASDE